MLQACPAGETIHLLAFELHGCMSVVRPSSVLSRTAEAELLVTSVKRSRPAWLTAQHASTALCKGGEPSGCCVSPAMLSQAQVTLSCRATLQAQQDRFDQLQRTVASLTERELAVESDLEAAGRHLARANEEAEKLRETQDTEDQIAQVGT